MDGCVRGRLILPADFYLKRLHESICRGLCLAAQLIADPEFLKCCSSPIDVLFMF